MKKKNHLRWTREEEEELVNLVKAHKGKLSVAFTAFQCAYKNRSVSSIANKWYELKNSPKKVCMSNVSKKRSTPKKTSSTKSRHTFLMKVWNSLTNLF